MDLEKKKQEGILDQENIRLTENKIRKSLLDLIDDIEQGDTILTDSENQDDSQTYPEERTRPVSKDEKSSSKAVRNILLPLILIVTLILYFKTRKDTPEPIPSDVIADFNVSQGTGALTNFGLPFSLMSDNSQNMSSIIWYKRIHDTLNEGFLRVFYQLKPIDQREGYVGIYGDFTTPPAKPIDMKEYNGISLKLRVNQKAEDLPEIRIVLYSDNIKNMQYAYPRTSVDPNSQWQLYNLPFKSFKTPSFAQESINLDPNRVFRFAILVVDSDSIQGYLDVDNITLF